MTAKVEVAVAPGFANSRGPGAMQGCAANGLGVLWVSIHRPKVVLPMDLAISQSMGWAYRWMFLSMVPFAQPQDVLRSCRNLAQGTWPGFIPLLVVDGWLVPSADVVGLRWAELLHGLMGDSPVYPADQALTILFVGEAVASLLGCLFQDGLSNDPPLISHVNVCLCQEGGFMAGPGVQAACGPSPFVQLAGVGLLSELFLKFLPCLLDVW